MGWGRHARIALGAIVVLILLVLAMPALTGRPVVSYAESGSMEPTIGTFDGYLVSPWPGTLEKGDIIVFESVTRGGPAVHRIVGGDARTGWYTQGDANPQPDQAGREPLVTGDRVLGRVITTPDGTPLTIPEVGVAVITAKMQVTRAANAVGGERQLLALSFLAVAVVSGASALLLRPAPRPAARMPRRLRAALHRAFPRGVLGRHLGLALLLVLVVSAGWAASQSRVELPLSIVVVEDPTAADGIRAAAPGGTIARVVEVGSLGFLPTVVLVEPASPRLDAAQESARIGPGERTRLDLEHIAGPDVGLQEDALRLWRYPAFLPEGAIARLHDVSPGLPYAALATIVAAVGALWFRTLGVSRLPVGRMIGLREDWR